MSRSGLESLYSREEDEKYKYKKKQLVLRTDAWLLNQGFEYRFKSSRLKSLIVTFPIGEIDQLQVQL